MDRETLNYLLTNVATHPRRPESSHFKAA